VGQRKLGFKNAGDRGKGKEFLEAGDVAQMVEHMPSKLRALKFKHQYTTKKKKIVNKGTAFTFPKVRRTR
jgi:hypothetical protein